MNVEIITDSTPMGCGDAKCPSRDKCLHASEIDTNGYWPFARTEGAIKCESFTPLKK